MRRATFLLLLVLLPAAARAAVEARVTYRTASTVYLDQGSEAGVAVGDSVEVLRAGAMVARLVVGYVSSRRCTAPLPECADVQVGDAARIRPGGGPRAAAPAPTEAAPPPAVRRWRGRVGLRWLGVRHHEDWGQDFDQPAADLRLRGRELAGGPLSVEVDARARHTFRRPAEGAKSDEGRQRVYRLWADWRLDPGGSSLRLGRQSSPELAHLSIFDGGALAWRSARWSAGAMAGTQPDREDFGPGGDVVEAGAFLQRRQREGERRWDGTVAAIASYEQGEIDREYLYLQGRYHDRRWSLFASQEIDVNRGWKKDLGAESVSPTSTFAHVRWEVERRLALRAGFDSRERVRLWRDRETPATDFEDRMRRGWWLGAEGRPARPWRLGLEWRRSEGGGAGAADAVALRAAFADPAVLPVDARARFTAYGNERFDGWMTTLGMGWSPATRLRLDLDGGLRRERYGGFVQEDTDAGWLSAEAEIQVEGGWFLWLSAEWTRGGIDASDLYQSALSWRF